MPFLTRRPRLFSCLFVIGVAVVCLAGTVMAPIFQDATQRCPPSTPVSSTGIPAQSSGRIVFTTWCDRNFEIYAIDADGSNLTNLTNDAVPPRELFEVDRPLGLSDEHPVWSPDGERIAFFSNRIHTAPGIYVMDADGSNLTSLTHSTRGGEHPAWSPDGNRIAFASGNIFVINTDGSNRIKLTNSTNLTKVNHDYPIWSPDGSHIVFRTFDDEEVGYFLSLIDADGSHLTRLTSDFKVVFLSRWPWSPDSTHITFSAQSSPDYRDYDIYVVSLKDHNVTRLTEDLDAGNPVWSPDGTRIAFSASHTDGRSIFTIAPDGSQLTRLTDGWEPAWSPDGTRLAFVSDRDGDDEIYVMDADGSNLIQLTDNTVRDGRPIWSP